MKMGNSKQKYTMQEIETAEIYYAGNSKQKYTMQEIVSRNTLCRK